jgi:hypothetical protein
VAHIGYFSARDREVGADFRITESDHPHHESADAQADEYTQESCLAKDLSHEDHPGNAHDGAKSECKQLQ